MYIPTHEYVYIYPEYTFANINENNLVQNRYKDSLVLYASIVAVLLNIVLASTN